MEIEGFTGSEIGFLRAGNWAATQSAMATLHRRGGLRLGTAGTVDRLPLSLVGCDVLERAIHSALTAPAFPREVMARPRVHSTFGAVRDRLAQSGLVRPLWWRIAVPVALVLLPAIPLIVLTTGGRLPLGLALLIGAALVAAALALSTRRTFYGSRALRRLRIRYADLRAPGDPGALTPAEVGMAVALFGRTALAAILPEARAAGLLDGAHWIPRPAKPANTPVSDPG